MSERQEKCPYCGRATDHTGTRYYITINGIDREEVCPVCYVRIELKLQKEIKL